MCDVHWLLLLWQNWIRNRRRPAAMKSAERLQERINQGDVTLSPQHSFSLVPTQTLPITTINANHMPRPVMTSAPLYYPVNSAGMISAQPPQGNLPPPSMHRHMPEAKRSCLDQSKCMLVFYEVLCSTYWEDTSTWGKITICHFKGGWGKYVSLGEGANVNSVKVLNEEVQSRWERSPFHLLSPTSPYIVSVSGSEKSVRNLLLVVHSEW